MAENPYEPPKSAFDGERDPRVLREVVLAWEKLRLLYNLILLIPGVGLLALAVSTEFASPSAAVFSGVLVGIGANAAFFLGPLVEIYIRGFFRNGAPLGRGRQLIFGAGLVVSAGVFMLAALGMLA